MGGFELGPVIKEACEDATAQLVPRAKMATVLEQNQGAIKQNSREGLSGLTRVCEGLVGFIRIPSSLLD